MEDLTLHARVLNVFGQALRQHGTLVLGPIEVERWLQDWVPREVYSDLVGMEHLELVIAGGLKCYALPGAVGQGCRCGCGCTNEVTGPQRPLCWPCWSSEKRHGPVEHIKQVLRRELVASAGGE